MGSIPKLCDEISNAISLCMFNVKYALDVSVKFFYNEQKK